MQLFWSEAPQNGKIYLQEEEARHLIKSLRKGIGEEVQCTDGKGYIYKCTLLNAERKSTVLEVNETKYLGKFWEGNLHIGIAMTKNPDRIEWFTEKAVEAGIDKISFILTQFAERSHLRRDRILNIIRSAMKQSYNIHLPEVTFEVPFSKIVDVDADQKLLATCSDIPKIPISKSLSAGKSNLILIGPEGDFSSAEINAASKAGFLGVDLGKSRLRTETAGLASIFAFHYSI